MRRSFLPLVCLIAALLLTGCLGQKDSFGAREAFAKKHTGDIVVGIPGPLAYMQDITGFYKGVTLAADEVNSNGGIKGSLIQLRVKDDKGTFSDGIIVAQEFALQQDMAAVIGHWNTYITLPAARIYNDAGLVMLSPVVSNPELTKKGYTYLFQNTINDEEMGRQMAAYAREKGYERVVVFYADNDYGRGLAGAFEDFFSENGGMVADRMTEFVNTQEFGNAYERWKAFEYDAVFIADSMPHAGEFIKMLRQKDSSIPIFSGDGLDVANLSSLLGQAAEGLVVATMYNPEREDERQKEFIEAFTGKYKEAPDVWAVQGYDSIKLLAYAIEKAQAPTPAEIAEVLHNLKEWQGVLGKAGFDASGKMTDRHVYKKVVSDGQMKYLDN